MSMLGWIGTALIFFGSAAWALVSVADKFDDLDISLTAPAEDVPGFEGGAAAARFPDGE